MSHCSFSRNWSCSAVSTPSATTFNCKVCASMMDCPGDRRVTCPFSDVGDERPVDLEGVDGKMLQVAEGRVAGPEIVDRDADPEVLEPSQRPRRGGGVLHGL